MKSIDWYFDFISPFAYLQSTRLTEIGQRAHVRCVPVLFAGLLAHWENKGPAEIPPKRQWTFDHVAWLAHRHGVALTLPPAHPFVPLRLLRLAIALGSGPDVVRRLFDFVWRDGRSPTDDAAFATLLAQTGTAPEAIEAPAVKATLRANTEQAIAAGVFGVPTAVVDGERFWGFDATEMLLARLGDDPFFRSPALAAARALPQGVQRRIPPAGEPRR